MMFRNNFWKMEAIACDNNIIKGEKYRFTLLTASLIRMEYRENGIFEDRPTQCVWNRNFEKVAHRFVKCEEGFELFTDRIHVIYDGKKFSSNGLSVTAFGEHHTMSTATTWHYGETKQNLGGTARTLDKVNGACELDNGIQAIAGSTVLDDSKSLVLTEDGWIAPRTGEGKDLYLFSYGTDYKKALKDFYRLTGKTPMLPRYALGNWWSRYYEYTENSYMELVNRFQKEGVPFSVAVIDMDWHLVDGVDPKYGTGWTGYTWNRDFFPEPARFLSWLHEHGMKASLNLHPADGIRAFEKSYLRMAEAMGNVDVQNEAPIDFDIANPQFLENYFEYVLHPEEQRGVDFWWIDWQQGNTTKVEGLDPLWMLNHYHFLDSARDGKRPITFSRYAGPGSHRYPIGFSGDTHMTWDSLDFQPYFTSTASNIGYGWWSHDIGGHMNGYRDNEMAVRWLQYGVFSPINRLHSSKSEFNLKEPWMYPVEFEQAMVAFLQLRHRLLPYIYTMNHRAYAEDMPLILPMYYEYPMDQNAYQVKNQYLFGTNLMVAPITTPEIEGVNRGKVKVWLPEGVFYDFFTGVRYTGGRMMNMYRDVHSIPVLAKAGAIIPMTSQIMGSEAVKNPDCLTICVYAGADGQFQLYEDDNETCNYQKGDCVTTEMTLDWSARRFTLRAPRGNLSLIPVKRSYEIKMYGVKNTDVVVTVGDESGAYTKAYDEKMGCLTVQLPELAVENEVNVVLVQGELKGNNTEQLVFELLAQAEIEIKQKETIYALVQKNKGVGTLLSELQAMDVSGELISAVTEIMTACEIKR